MKLRRMADVDLSTVSRHLERLRSAGIVDCRKEGQRVSYRVKTPCIVGAFECAAAVLRAMARRAETLLKGA